MKINFRGKKIWGAAMLAVVFTIGVLAKDRGLPVSEGILNFGKVSDGLYRGAQPDEAAIQRLKTMGVKMIISLRQPKEDVKIEAAEAQASGIVFTNIPLPGLMRPKDADVRKVLTLIEASPGAVFVHCEHGCDRTGTVVACYRIEHDHWSVDEAMREAEKYGISKLERGMRRYVAEFARSESKSTTGAAIPAH